MDQNGCSVSSQFVSCLVQCTDVTSGVAMCIGGPALVYYVSPTEEELFKVSKATKYDLPNVKWSVIITYIG